MPTGPAGFRNAHLFQADEPGAEPRVVFGGHTFSESEAMELSLAIWRVTDLLRREREGDVPPIVAARPAGWQKPEPVGVLAAMSRPEMCPDWCEQHEQITDPLELRVGVEAWEHRRVLASGGGWRLVLVGISSEDGDGVHPVSGPGSGTEAPSISIEIDGAHALSQQSMVHVELTTDPMLLVVMRRAMGEALEALGIR